MKLKDVPKLPIVSVTCGTTDEVTIGSTDDVTPMEDVVETDIELIKGAIVDVAAIIVDVAAIIVDVAAIIVEVPAINVDVAAIIDELLSSLTDEVGERMDVCSNGVGEIISEFTTRLVVNCSELVLVDIDEARELVIKLLVDTELVVVAIETPVVVWIVSNRDCKEETTSTELLVMVGAALTDDGCAAVVSATEASMVEVT